MKRKKEERGIEAWRMGKEKRPMTNWLTFRENSTCGGNSRRKIEAIT